MGCFGKGCLILIGSALVLFLVFCVCSYLFFTHGVISSKPADLPIKELPPQELSAVQERIQQFESTPPTPIATPTPTPTPGETPAPEGEATPTPPPGRELVLSAAEINGLIANSRHGRGHAFVTINGDTANVQMSVPSDKIPGFPRGYLNGTFTITAHEPTPIRELQVSKVAANGYPVPSSVLSMSYRGRSILGYALEGAAPYNVSTAEIRDGNVILH
jgi:hypothetical protein